MQPLPDLPFLLTLAHFLLHLLVYSLPPSLPPSSPLHSLTPSFIPSLLHPPFTLLLHLYSLPPSLPPSPPLIPQDKIKGDSIQVKCIYYLEKGELFRVYYVLGYSAPGMHATVKLYQQSEKPSFFEVCND